jgi:hypothetical protein
MKFDENLAAVHAYLCADGYVIKNPREQKQKYYIIGFRNTNLDLLQDYQKRFFYYFNVEPHLHIGQRCQLGSREIYKRLINEFGSFYSNEWSMPYVNENLMKIWLRAFFDCEGWVFCKTHQNRHIGLDSINEKGLDRIKESLEKIGIKSVKKISPKRKMFRILIYGKQNLIKFKQEIGFFHPQKKEKLEQTVSDFVSYNWVIKQNKNSIRQLMLEKAKIKKPYYTRVISKEERNLRSLKTSLCNLFKIKIQAIRIYERTNGIGTKYFELNINEKQEIEKLIKQNLINQEQLLKINRVKLKC